MNKPHYWKWNKQQTHGSFHWTSHPVNNLCLIVMTPWPSVLPFCAQQSVLVMSWTRLEYVARYHTCHAPAFFWLCIGKEWTKMAETREAQTEKNILPLTEQAKEARRCKLCAHFLHLQANLHLCFSSPLNENIPYSQHIIWSLTSDP